MKKDNTVFRLGQKKADALSGFIAGFLVGAMGIFVFSAMAAAQL